MKKNTKKGFTLVELLVVIAILAILASVAVVGYTSFIAKADQSKADTELKQVVNIVNAEYAEEGAATQAEIEAFLAANVEIQALDGEVTVTVANGVVTLTYTTTKGAVATATLTAVAGLPATNP